MEPTGKNVILCLLGTLVLWVFSMWFIGEDKSKEGILFIPQMATFFTVMLTVFWTQYKKE